MKRYFLYLARWQLSGIVLAPVLYLMTGANPMESAIATIVANLIGGMIFFWIDRRIFKKP
jgi:membrane protein YqaA with SNARE-associated domain